MFKKNLAGKNVEPDKKVSEKSNVLILVVQYSDIWSLYQNMQKSFATRIVSSCNAAFLCFPNGIPPTH